MKRIKLGLVLILLALSALWLLADPLTLGDGGYFAWRSLAINYTGVLGMGVMSIAMGLALRPRWLEPWVDGLDKGYRLHKWLGIAGLTLATTHWLWAQGSKWAVGWGWLERPQRTPRPEQTVELFRFFQEQRGLAESIGEWAFYAFAVLGAIALIKRLPYRRFFQTHRLLPAVYLALVVHSVVLLPFTYWLTPLGGILGLLMVAGSYAAFRSIAGRIGHGNKVAAHIAEVARHPDNEVLEVTLALDGPWPGHDAGQFAFVTFDAKEGPHPFTIASAWQNDQRMRFMIKPIGDYTRQLPQQVHAGDPAFVEGPYGCFDFEAEGDARRQIWVAGGIGITPFIARLQALAERDNGALVDLFYSTRQPDQGFIERIEALAARARVRLHVLIADRDGLLDADAICRNVPDWKASELWFCGPAAFGTALRTAFNARGLGHERFHQELFEMR